MHITPIKPSGITLLATLRCTAACDNCCFGCNPKQGRSMTFEEMKDYVDKSLEAYPDSITKLCLTGGECMLLGKEVDKIISYAQSKGLNTSIVSNAYWATDYDKAYRTLKRLKNKGLTSACFSTGEDHNQYVPWMNVRHAAVAAARLGIVNELRVENQLLHTEIIRELNADEEVTELVSQYKLQIATPYWMEYDNKGKKSRHFKMRLMDSEEKIPCNHLFQDIIINPYGEVYACCGIGVCHIPQMRLGNIHQEPIQTIYERAFEDVLKIWLYTEGPQDVLAFVEKKTGQKFNWHTRHNCDICRTIFTDKSILPILRDNVFEAASMPLLFYHCKAKTENERRTKQ